MTVTHTSFVLGYHGCRKSVEEDLLAGTSIFLPSENTYDWLGHGIYFWETNPQRALSWAKELQSKNSDGKWNNEEPFAGFREKTHVQICVRNAQCIKGIFRVSSTNTH